MRIAFIADPPSSFKIYKDSTYAMMVEAAKRGHELHFMLQEGLMWKDGRILGDSRRLTLTAKKDPWYEAAASKETPLAEFDAVLKPLDGMGGESVFRVAQNDPNRNVIIETLVRDGAKSVMAQRYIPEIRDGDKRILLIAGKAVPHCLARIPKPGETRGNLAAGGTGVAKPLSKRDLEIANSLGPDLASQGLLLVGLDVIGDYLTEINVTSPTCFQEITQQTGFNVARMFLDAVEAAVR